MVQGIYKILVNQKIANDIYEMILFGDTSAIKNSGQFINIQLDGFYLRRPISICDYDKETITIIYKVVGKGTEKMAELRVGETLDCLIGLGNGFDTSVSGDRPLLIGGGVGIPPLFNLCKKLVEEGKKPTVVLGFNSESDAFYIPQFKELTENVCVATADGSLGVKGFVTAIVEKLEGYTYFYTCGPEGMLKALYDVTTTSGQLSFEERMGCGFGACMGCTCETKYGNKRICKDGPVLVKEEIIW
ncbi:MAG: dihydroorotate dehydrogenase electron transfer subunit [Anaerofustis stercorihominis]|nr:dihydroorotate dehydrogenase electron transfer subunit [Anaerofustis stercorihominis]